MLLTLWWIVLGLVAASLNGRVMESDELGAFMDIVIGIAGALVGGFTLHFLGFKAEGR